MTLLYYPLSYWTLTGMETGLLTLLLLASLIAAGAATPGGGQARKGCSLGSSWAWRT